jgi:hypothetical protein
MHTIPNVTWLACHVPGEHIAPTDSLLCLIPPQAFWVPSQAPEAKDLMTKPDTATYCPASGKKLRLKDCVAVKFTQVRHAAMHFTPVIHVTRRIG